jgi:signal transduction histidine kinase
VILNLIRNSVDAMPAGGTITTSADYRLDRREFVLSVRDQGVGIPKEHMDRIFSPFFSTKPVGKGTGLGLAICYGIAKIHRGQIRAFNNPDGRGSTFEMVLPANGSVGEELS